MIVICTRCQAKFRVADEKVGPRGAKIRCSRCETIFVVQRDPAPAAPEAAAAPAASPSPDPFAPPADDPFAAFAAAARPPAPAPPRARDPFAALGLDAAAKPPAAGPDPFASGGADPFAFSAAADPFAPQAAAAALAQAADPFAAAVSPRAGAAPLPVTDLSDLLGDAARAAPPPAPPAPSPAPPVAPGFSAPFDPGEISFDDAPGPGADLALEERAPPPAPPPRGSLDELPEPDLDTATPGPSGLAFADPGAVSFMSGPGDAPLALATETTPFPAAPPPLPPAAAARDLPAPRAAPAAGDRADASAPADPSPEQERIPGARGGRLRAVAVNAVALAALLLVALAIRVAWRGEPVAGALGAGILAALGKGGGAAAAPFTAVEVSNGAYERARGTPLLFVRGKVLSRAPAPVPRVRVEVEIVRGGHVLARGAALAGAVPTAEELWGAADRAALDAVEAAAAARAPAGVRPGDAVPFLVAIAEPPPDLAGATLRVTAGAAP